ncbi:hypothetical protein [Photobacterium sp. GB-210]|uniref:hypothetical protein n=1 Tax=Photobacterium sp. GB-210 TaxID=2022104 RepID=UPI000D153150|nr:hypothetical protein [Photobacterium sp. GB-210]PSV35333.1 hypothetical protein C9J38_15980 [Photobacterium sp. GB-210]
MSDSVENFCLNIMDSLLLSGIQAWKVIRRGDAQPIANLYGNLAAYAAKSIHPDCFGSNQKFEEFVLDTLHLLYLAAKNGDYVRHSRHLDEYLPQQLRKLRLDMIEKHLVHSRTITQVDLDWARIIRFYFSGLPSILIAYQTFNRLGFITDAQFSGHGDPNKKAVESALYQQVARLRGDYLLLNGIRKDEYILAESEVEVKRGDFRSDGSGMFIYLPKITDVDTFDKRVSQIRNALFIEQELEKVKDYQSWMTACEKFSVDNAYYQRSLITNKGKALGLITALHYDVICNQNAIASYSLDQDLLRTDINKLSIERKTTKKSAREYLTELLKNHGFTLGEDSIRLSTKKYQSILEQVL